MPSFIEENGLPQLVVSGTNIPGKLSSRFYGLETNKENTTIYIYIYIYIYIDWYY